MTNYQVQLLLRPELVLRRSSYPKSKGTHCFTVAFSFFVLNVVDAGPDNFFSVIGDNSVTRGHAYELYRNYSRLNTRKHFFCSRVANVWKALEASPADFRTLQTLNQF